MSFAFSIDFIELTSDFQTPVTFLLVDKNTKCILFHNWIIRNIFGNKIVRICAEIFILLTPAPVVSVTLRNVIINMASFAIMHVIM